MYEFHKQIHHFSAYREWRQFHTPKDLLGGIGEEIGELTNGIKWEQNPEKLRIASYDNTCLGEHDNLDVYWFHSLIANSVGVNT